MPRDTQQFLTKKQAGEPIVMVTCYDYPMAQMEDAAGADIIFVGDSVGTNMLGYAAETEVTMADMLHHLKAVRRGVERAYLLVDMPYRSYETPECALENAQLFLEHGADGVKLEGGQEQVPVIEALVATGIAVCGHIGFTPQTLGTNGRIQGKTLEQRQTIVRDALALENAGVFMLVLEMVTEPISQLISERLKIPTIGIGAGRYCDGQVLVVTDLLGLSTVERRIFKRYEQLQERIVAALGHYGQEVRSRQFPTKANAFQNISPEDMVSLRQWVLDKIPDG